MRDLLKKRILFFGGKGGVGKTTCASAMALAASRAGKRVLLVSTDPAHSTSDIFERPIPESDYGIAVDAASGKGTDYTSAHVIDLTSGESRRVSNGKGRVTCAYFTDGGRRVLYASTHLADSQ